MPRPMKDSGVEWLGEIPAHWEIARLKDIKSDNNYSIVDGPFGTAISTSDYVDVGVPLARIVNLDGTKLNESNFVYITEEHAANLERSRFYKGDIIFAKTGATVGKCAINSNIESGILSSSCVKIQVDKKYLNKFFYYFFSTTQFNEALRMACNGTTRDTINLKPFSCLNCVLPPLDEQQRIATFLDGECARIDSVVEKTRASIEEYRKLKQAIITRAVTKGIRPNRPTKDSGIDWIGQIPADWEILSFTKSICSIVDYRGKTPEKQDEGTLLVTARNIKDGKIDYDCSREFVRTEDFDEIMHRGKVEIGDVLFTTEAPLGSVANADRTNFALAQRIIKFRGFPDVLDNYYLKFWIMSDSFQQNLATFSTGSTAKGIKASKLGMLKQVLPPLDEQQEIADYLDEKTAAIDSLVAKKNRLVSELASLKKSLIFEYVTGKKEVPK